MQEDEPILFAVGDVVSWPVVMVDVEASDLDWPVEIPVETAIMLQPGPYAVTRDLTARWDGYEMLPLNSEFRVRAALLADFFNAPGKAYVTGVVRKLAVVASALYWQERDTILPDGMPSASWMPTSDWHLREVALAPRWF
jgi:hypothetical protein